MKTTETVEALVKGAVEGEGFTLCDVEFQKEAGNWVLTLFIDREGGVTIDDCEAVSRLVDPILDEADPIDQAYYLSVSSLGIDRPLKKPADYERSLGKELEVRLYAPKAGKKQLVGTLESFTEEEFTLQLEDGRRVTLLKKDAALVRPHIRF
ncbi:MAG: ribosome maturation factor RimP [Clostridia bacterium]|nr:ribosome maturation factor RimP [Clostridia bacterium]